MDRRPAPRWSRPSRRHHWGHRPIMSEQDPQPASSDATDASAIDNHFIDMAEKYLGWAKADVGRIEELIRSLRTTPSDEDAIDQVFKVAHGIKGQGSTFGYELMTEVGQGLSEYLKKRPNPLTMDQLNVIEQHARAMQLILERKITGTGGERRARSSSAASRHWRRRPAPANRPSYGITERTSETPAATPRRTASVCEKRRVRRGGSSTVLLALGAVSSGTVLSLHPTRKRLG